MGQSRQFTDFEMIARYAGRVNYLGVDGCWVWQGRLNNWGYGETRRNQKITPAHRLFYELLVGPIPEGMVIDHTCRNHQCVNPDHLQAVSHGENVGLGRLRKTHCPQDHELTEDNVWRDKRGHRHCRTCLKGQQAAAYQRRKARLASKEN